MVVLNYQNTLPLKKDIENISVTSLWLKFFKKGMASFMDIWTSERWKLYYSVREHRSGLYVDYEKTVDPNVKRAISEFVKWLRSEYVFPKRVRVYVKAKEFIKARDGDMVYGTAFLPFNRDDEPYIRIATGDYPHLVRKNGVDNALAANLSTLAHELTHYFQWLNDVHLTPKGEERQASNHSNKILDLYAQTREHP